MRGSHLCLYGFLGWSGPVWNWNSNLKAVTIHMKLENFTWNLRKNCHSCRGLSCPCTHCCFTLGDSSFRSHYRVWNGGFVENFRKHSVHTIHLGLVPSALSFCCFIEKLWGNTALESPTFKKSCSLRLQGEWPWLWKIIVTLTEGSNGWNVIGACQGLIHGFVVQIAVFMAPWGRELLIYGH